MNNYDAILRMSNIFTLLCTPQSDATIANISAALCVPADVIRRDITAILKNDIFYGLLQNEELDPYDTQLLTDSTNISMDASSFHFPYDTVPLFLTHTEKELLREYFPELAQNILRKRQYLIKDVPYTIVKPMTKLSDQIQMAIDNRYCVKFSYKTGSTSQYKIYEVEPHLLYHNINNGRIYLLSYNGTYLSSYRLDRISNLTACTKQKQSALIPQETLCLFDYLWGMDFSTKEEPFRVKLRIHAYNKNILEKIKQDTSRRKYAKLYTDHEYWYYEDVIIGMSAFRSWVNQFGYSVIVLSPEPLARQIYDSAQRRLEKYTYK